MYFVEISTRSSTAYDVTPTASSSAAADSLNNFGVSIAEKGKGSSEIYSQTQLLEL